jgi:hypothetical protein
LVAVYFFKMKLVANFLKKGNKKKVVKQIMVVIIIQLRTAKTK